MARDQETVFIASLVQPETLPQTFKINNLIDKTYEWQDIKIPSLLSHRRAQNISGFGTQYSSTKLQAGAEDPHVQHGNRSKRHSTPWPSRDLGGILSTSSIDGSGVSS